jgi:TetR/AcrR family transcriptional regulator
MKSASNQGPRSARGRPPKTPAETEAIRAVIKSAAAKAFAEHGYHNLSVEQILQNSGVSRPTFYRYFDNTQDVLDLILTEVNVRLVDDLHEALHAAPDVIGKLAAGLLAWHRWSEWVGPILPSIYAVLYDKSTLVAQHGQRTRAAVMEEIDDVYRDLGRPPPERVRTETFLIGLEYLGYRFLWEGEGVTTDAVAQDVARQAMFRLAIGMLGTHAEWAMAPQLAERFGVKLDE